MTRQIGLVVNPRSHAVATRGSLLEAAALDLPDACFLRLDDFADLVPCARQMAERGVRMIFVEGGDGTLLAVLSACLDPAAGFTTLPDFAILPGGSTNLAADIFGFRGRTPGEITRRIETLANGVDAPERAHHRALRVTGIALPRPAIGFVLSTGSLARAMLYAQREFHGAGRRGARAVAGAVWRFLLAPGRYRDTDGAPVLRGSDLGAVLDGRQRADGVHAFSLMTTLPRLSLGLRPFWGGGAGAIAMTHAAWPIRGLRWAMVKIVLGLTGPGLARHGLHSFRADRIALHHAGPTVIDGEFLPPAPDHLLEVSVTDPISFLR